VDIVFSEKSYKEFLSQKETIFNTRIRPNDESVWDALLSDQADFTKLPNGKEILATLNKLGE
jgi:hypothetical protein